MTRPLLIFIGATLAVAFALWALWQAWSVNGGG